MEELLKMLMALENNGGLTLKGYKPVTHKTGYQLADYGAECHTLGEAVVAVYSMNGNAGVWYSEGVYYIDHSFRVKTKHEALELGRKYNQQSVLSWATMELIWC